MKAVLYLLAAFSCTSLVAHAASMSTTWTGGAGPTSSNIYDLNNAANWSNGVPSRGSGQGPDLIFSNTGTIVINGGIVDTSDGGSIMVTGNSNVTVSGTRYTGNVTVGAGSVLTKNGSTDFKNSVVNIDGTFNLNVAGVDPASGTIRLIFGIGGIMNISQALWGSSSFNVSGMLGTVSADLTAGTYRFVTRTLITTGGFQTGNVALGAFTDASGGSLTKVGEAMTGNAADYEGKYYLYRDGNTIKVQYVETGAVVPEPATATLGLLGLAALMMRRRV